MNNNTISDAHSVVYASDGSRHKVCWNPAEETAAFDELASAGDIPVVFSRRTRRIVNNHVGNSTGTVIMAGTVGGVNIR